VWIRIKGNVFGQDSDNVFGEQFRLLVNGVPIETETTINIVTSAGVAEEVLLLYVVEPGDEIELVVGADGGNTGRWPIAVEWPT
jgi:hypothetical protein